MSTRRISQVSIERYMYRFREYCVCVCNLLTITRNKNQDFVCYIQQSDQARRTRAILLNKLDNQSIVSPCRPDDEFCSIECTS